MKQLIFSVIGVFLFINVNAQLEFGTHFMKDLTQSNYTNPSVFNNFKVNVALPSVYGGFYNSGFKLNSIVERRGTSLVIDMDNLVDGLGDNGLNLQSNLNIETFAFSFQAKKWQISLNHGMRVAMHYNFPKEMLQFAWGGNSQFVDETINVAPSLNMVAYQEFGLGFGYKLSKNLSLGTRLKYLVGNAVYNTASAKASIYTDPEFYELTAETDYLINSGGLPAADFNNGEFFNFDGFEPSLFGANKGFAIDFGASFDVNEKLNIQTSILNIGKINWKKNVNNYLSQGTFEFGGLDLQPVLDEGTLSGKEILDTIKNTFNFTSTQNDFSSVLPSTFYLSGTYEVAKRFYVGALFFTQGHQSEFTSAFALNVKKEFGSIFSLGAQYAMIEGRAHNIGLSTSLRLGPIQLFATTDNVVPVLNPLRGQNVNIRMGMNLVFGRKDKKCKVKEGDQPDALLKK